MKKKIGLISLFVVSMFLFVGCGSYNYKIVEVEATVIEKDFTDSWIQIISTGKTTIPITHSATYDVTVQYEHLQATIDNKFFFENVKEGDTVTVHYFEGYDNAGNLKKTYIDFIKEDSK